ncbi:MAG: phage terminase large subunit family protein [Candidatus Taylorbacteria bacterium]|nr:phage terminase large subunit family protein [Candidatus Taylorbacteria bacterium]
MANINEKFSIDPADFSIHSWIRKYGIKNEKGDPIEFKNHLFLYDIYRDQSSQIVCMKAAQIGFSTLAILKNIYDAMSKRMEIIHTLATDHDAAAFVSGKVDRIIANNQIFADYVSDKDSVEQKKIGKSMIYFKGTWSKRAAITTTADRLVHDEKDSSKLDIIADYQARLQHSKFKQTHMFSHPSLPETGIHNDWLKSDQKHWFIKCTHCNYEQYLNWNTEDSRKMSIDIERKVFVCTKCNGVIDDKTRATGWWQAKYPGRPVSGYWIPLLIAPWVSAADIIAKFQDPNTTPEFFYTKVLGLPYADGTAKLLREHFLQNLTGTLWAPSANERIVIGVDTGLKIDYVMGSNHGIFYHGECKDYNELDERMRRWPRAIAIVDQGGDLIGSRKFYYGWPGRVFLCALTGDRTTKELISWKTGNEHGAVTVDRNRMIQFVIDHFRDKRIPVHGTENDWYDYWLDWNNLSKMKVLDPDTNQVKGYKFVRSGRDHLALATIFWMVGMQRFAGTGFIINPEMSRSVPNSYMMNYDGTVSFDPEEMFKLRPYWWAEDEEDDWRNI